MIREPEELKKIRQGVKERTITLMLAGFGLVAALAWNDAIQTMFRVLFPQSEGLLGKFVYAILVTVIIVIISTRVTKKEEEEKNL